MIKLYTEDNFLGGHIVLKQPKEGFRSGSDGVFLASSLSHNTKGRILDVGCGTGVASLCLGWRMPKVEIVGIDCQNHMIDLAQENAQKNNLHDRVTFLVEDIRSPREELQPQSFDCVISNPPYFKNSTSSDDSSRAISRGYKDDSLQVWVNYCIKMGKPRGFLHFIFPTDSLQTLLNCLGSKAGGIALYPLWAKEDSSVSKRIIVTARKDVESPTILHKGMILHNDDGTYTQSARKILWDGKGFFDGESKD